MSTTPGNQVTTSLPDAYAHTVDYFSKGIDQQGAFYKVRYYIDDWSKSDAFINALRGIAQLTGGATTRLTPHQHPLSPNLFCVSAVVVQGVGLPVFNSNGYPLYQDGRGAGGALIDAEYRPMTPYPLEMTSSELAQQIDPTTPLLWCTQELDFQTEYITIQNSQVTWQAGPHNGQPVAGLAFRIRVPLTILSLTYHLVPYMPSGTIQSLQGKVNSSTFLGAVAGTVFFSGARVMREANTDGTVAQKVQLTFMVRTTTGQLWNYLPDPSDLNWYSVKGTGGGTLYPSADFTPLGLF